MRNIIVTVGFYVIALTACNFGRYHFKEQAGTSDKTHEAESVLDSGSGKDSRNLSTNGAGQTADVGGVGTGGEAGAPEESGTGGEIGTEDEDGTGGEAGTEDGAEPGGEAEPDAEYGAEPGGEAPTAGTGGEAPTAGTGGEAPTAGTGGEAPTAGTGGDEDDSDGPVPKIPEPSEECPSFQSGSMTVMGMTATINAGKPGPIKGAIVFGFHGAEGMGSGNVPTSVQADITSEGGIIVVPRYSGGQTDIAPPTSTWYVSNIDWVDLLVACSVKNHNIDPKRIYATGCSAGGLMSGTLGLMRSEYLAAIAPNSGGINSEGAWHLSDPSHAPAAFLMNGGEADNVIVNFGQTSEWFAAEALKGANKPYILNCNHAIGHCMAPVALQEMAWEFMKAHPFNVVESPWKTSPPADLPTYCQVME